MSLVIDRQDFGQGTGATVVSPQAVGVSHGSPGGRRSEGKHRSVEAVMVGAASFSVFFTVAMLLDFKYFSFPGDAVSRMANGFYIIHSRDPHLAAVGFVWNPLASIADLPLLLFNSVWPDLASHNVAGTTMSALAMMGAAYQLHAILREWRVDVAPRLVMTALFVFNPMILLYAGDGMSEAGYLFTTIATTRYLLRWIRRNDLRSLAYAAVALGLGYLQRNECVGAAALAGPLVLCITYARTSGDRRTKIWSSLTDATIFLIPIITTVVGWAVASFVITGQAFGQFTSQYGNSAQLANAHLVAGHYGARLLHEAKDLSFIGPMLPVILIVAIGVAIRRKSFLQIVGIFSVLGGILAFSLVGYLANSVFPWFRFYIAAIPIQVLLVGCMFAPAPAKEVSDAFGSYSPSGAAPARGSGPRHGTARVLAAAMASIVAIVLLAPSVIGTGRGMLNPTVGLEEIQDIGYIFNRHQSGLDQNYEAAYGQVRHVAHYLDGMRLPVGDVIADTADSCIPSIVTNVSNPREFVITNDRDFQRVLADPLTFHARYYMIQAEKGASSDAVHVAYPTASSRAGWSTLVHTFHSQGACGGIYLYKVTGHPNLGG